MRTPGRSLLPALDAAAACALAAAASCLLLSLCVLCVYAHILRPLTLGCTAVRLTMSPRTRGMTAAAVPKLLGLPDNCLALILLHACDGEPFKQRCVAWQCW